MLYILYVCLIKWAHSEYDTINEALKHLAHIRQVSVPDTGDPHHTTSHI